MVSRERPGGNRLRPNLPASVPADDLAQNLLRRGLASKADLFLAQMQNYLGLGGDARMNEPGTLKPKNWRWRVTSEQLTPTLAHTLRTLAEEAGRLPNYETQERTVYE